MCSLQFSVAVGKPKLDVMKQAPPAASGKLAAGALDMRLKGGAMETIYIGVDFHARQQTICYLTTETGEFVRHELGTEQTQRTAEFFSVNLFENSAALW